MQALVTYPYRDRETGEVRYAGETVELSADRFRELALKGHVDEARAPVAERAAPEPAVESEAPREDAPQAGAMSAAELRAAIEAKGGFAPKKATKAQLAEILGSL